MNVMKRDAFTSRSADLTERYLPCAMLLLPVDSRGCDVQFDVANATQSSTHQVVVPDNATAIEKLS
jgi:hypothetical protein